MPLIREVFSQDIDRAIEPVIKVDQTDAAVVQLEIGEYVVTDSIDRSLCEVLERYQEARQHPTDSIGVWVSGFFGSGKSSFAKFLGLALADSKVGDHSAGQLLSNRLDHDRTRVLLQQISENIPTDSVIFDVASERKVISANQSITEILYFQLLAHLGYAPHLELAELEIVLEDDDELDAFKSAYKALNHGEWDEQKHQVARAIGRAGAAMHQLYPNIYANTDSWWLGVHGQADINAARLAERAIRLMDRRGGGRNLVFVVDEVGQYISRDAQKMLDMQAVVQQFGIAGRGKIWILVTAQEKLSEVVSGLGDRRIELARLQDRFPLRVHLEPSDISEVTGKRVLRKSPSGEALIGDLFDRHQGALAENTSIAASAAFPSLNRQPFVDLYPLLPYQVELMIDVVSGLRTQGGAGRHVGGANRTIVKLAQQLLVSPHTDIQHHDVGALVRADHIFDLVRDDVDGELRAKIDAVDQRVDHPLAGRVAKAICLLGFVPVIPRTAENIAAVLHPACDAQSVLADVREAIGQLATSQLIREEDGQYRIPTPREDTWETQRASLTPTPGEAKRAMAKALGEIWAPAPSFELNGIQAFRGALEVDGHSVVAEGELVFHLESTTGDANAAEVRIDAQDRSRQDESSIYWVFQMTSEIDHAVIDLCRSDDMLSKSGGRTVTKEETQLMAAERRRRDQTHTALRRSLEQALLSGLAFHSGNDRAVAGSTPSAAASGLLGSVLPAVFNRHRDAAGRPSKGDFDAVLNADTLDGLPAIFNDLGLLASDSGTITVNLNAASLTAVLRRIQERYGAGDADTGRSITAHFATRPFGWSADMTRLLVATLVRGGVVTLQANNQSITSLTTPEGRAAVGNSNSFRAARLHPRTSRVSQADLIDAARNAERVFGVESPGLDLTTLASHIRKMAAAKEAGGQDAISEMKDLGFPQRDDLVAARDTLRLLHQSPEDDEVVALFNGSAVTLQDAIAQGAAITGKLAHAPFRDGIVWARDSIALYNAQLSGRGDLETGVDTAASELEETLGRPNFYDFSLEIRAHADVICGAHADLRRSAIEACKAAHERALGDLHNARDFAALDAIAQDELSRGLSQGTQDPPEVTPIREIELRTSACSQVLADALAELAARTADEPPIAIRLSAIAPGGITSLDDLDATLEALRVACAEHLEQGRTVLLQ